MNIENKFARFMRNSGPARFFVPAGIILIVFGILTLGFNTDNFEKTVGTITSVTEVPRTDTDEATQYDVGFRYTVDGKEYASHYLYGGPTQKYVGERKIKFSDYRRWMGL